MPPLLPLTLTVPLVWALLEDLRCRRVPNIVPVSVAALFAIHMASSSDPARGWWGLATGVALFAALFVVWSRGWIGAGDVKLAAAVGLWIGPEQLPLFLLGTTLLGGLMAIALLLSATPWAGAIAAVAGHAPRPAAAPAPTVPYAVAIVVAALAILLPDLLA